MNRPIDMAHVLGLFAKWFAILLVFGFSVTLSFIFFLSITPPDKWWFTYTAMGLTEGGFIAWMCVFMLTKHHAVHKGIAGIMACACALCSLVVAGYEFYALMSSRYDLVTNPQIIQGVTILLEIIFAAHIVFFIVDLFASYFERPGHVFRDPYYRNFYSVAAQQAALQITAEQTGNINSEAPITAEVRALASPLELIDPLLSRLPGRKKKGIPIPAGDASTLAPATLNSQNSINEPARDPGLTSGK